MLSRHRLLAALAATIVAVVAAIALPGGSDPQGSPSARASAHGSSARAAQQPTLTRPHPQAVEPVAGESGAVAALPTDQGQAGAAAGPAASTSKGHKLPAYNSGPTADAAVSNADVLKNGIALPPIEAPEEVRNIVRAGNQIARTPYLWGGGHGKWLDKGYDCSGSISYALASGGLLDAPLDSGRLMGWGQPGKGKWITIYANAGHVFMVVAGVRFDTSGTRATGSRWQPNMRSTGGFVARHPVGF